MHEHVITRHEVYISDECFLTGTAAEIIPVVMADGAYREGKPQGYFSLMKKFKEITHKEGVRY